MTDAFASRQKRAQVAGAARADQHTALIRNAWYVAARSAEIGRELLARSVLGTSTVMFRREDGQAVALQNRCCHRSFPLVDGQLDGDILTCGYHGLKYDANGVCIEIPMQQRKPSGIALKAYRLIERGGFIWLWGGRFDDADESSLPHAEWLESPQWKAEVGYLHIKSSYVHLHENLLDLSHLSFLHAASFGTPEYARAPVEIQIEGHDIQAWREVECVLPAIYAKPLGWEGMKARRRSGSQFVAPGLHINTGILTNLELPLGQQQPQPTVKVLQLLTPETQHTTHYWYAQCRNFEVGNDAMGAFMLKANEAAFQEDQVALERITVLEQLDRDPDYFEIDIATDRPGIAMRQYLKACADAEQRESPGG